MSKLFYDSGVRTTPLCGDGPEPVREGLISS
jgi:hypothetical protein